MPVSGLSDGLVAGGVVIPLVQAQVLGAFRPTHDYTLHRQPEESRIVDIGSGHYRAQGPATPVDQDVFLAAGLATVCRVASNSAPRNVPFPLSNRLTAIPSLPPPSSRHSSISTARHPPAPHAPPNAGRSGEWCCHPPIPWVSGSTGRNCAYGR